MSDHLGLPDGGLKAYAMRRAMALLREAKQFYGHLAILSGLSAAAALGSYLFKILLANALGPETFGLYSYIFILGSLATLFISYEMDHTAPVLFARTGDPEAVIALVFTLRGALLGVLVIAGIPVIALLRAGGEHWPLVVFGTMVLSIQALNFSFAYEIGKRNIRYLLIYLGERVFFIVGGLVLILCGVDEIAPYLAILAATTAISLTIQGLDNWKLFTSPHRRLLGQTLMGNTPLFAISISTYAYGGLSRIVLEAQQGLSEVGVYSAAWQLVAIGTLFQSQVDRVWRLRIAHAATDADYTALRGLVRSYLLFATGPMALFAVVLSLAAPRIVQVLFNESYAGIVLILPVMATYLIVVSLNGLARMLWVAFGDRKLYLVITVAGALITLAALIVLPGVGDLTIFASVVVGGHSAVVLTLLVTIGLKIARRMPRLS